jgi:hypothetical protein
MVTGESKPVAKKAGDAVISGTVNSSGPLVIKVLPNVRESLPLCNGALYGSNVHLMFRTGFSQTGCFASKVAQGSRGMM